MNNLKMLPGIIYFAVCVLYTCESFSVQTQPPPTSPAPPACEYEGQYYEPGSDFQPNACTWCTCPEEGGLTMCAMATCSFLQCVDSTTIEGQCCPSCPNGPNCYAGDIIIPVGNDVVVGDSICRCEGYYEHAICWSRGCLYSGIRYEAGTDFSPSPCEFCHCPGDNSEAFCAILDCAEPQCVDQHVEDDQCCPICPHGPNCYLGTQIIPAGVEYNDNGRICVCPGGFHNQAICTETVTLP